MMAVVGKELIKYFYGSPPKFSYWYGCSTGGRQGQMMAQKYPEDYQGILAGSAAIHFDQLGLGQMWPQIPMLMETGAPIAASKLKAATAAAVAECDGIDGVIDHEIRDPRVCDFNASKLICTTAMDAKADCLTPGEATAINKIWQGPTDANGESMWYGLQRGAELSLLAGNEAWSIPDEQGKYWVYLDPNWDYRSLNYTNWQSFFDKTVKTMEPTIGTDSADLRPFRDYGHKLLMWHGWADQIIMPEGSIDFFDQVTETMSGGNVSKTQEFARLFMAPGIGHCTMNTGPLFAALLAWVEDGKAPDKVIVNKVNFVGKRHRPLCPHPLVAVYNGTGSIDDAESFECGPNLVKRDNAQLDKKANERIFGRPFLPPPKSEVDEIRKLLYV
jgi:pimeloyl-ACP methyl ester carboxylesterase